MTQALNLALFANKLNTSGATDNTGLQNNSITINTTSPITGGATPALGGSMTIAHATSGVTAAAYTNANITVNAQGHITAASNGITATGTVTNVATGNGLQGGPITSTGTLSVACPGFNTVGSYCYVTWYGNGATVSAGGNYAAGGGIQQIASTSTGGDSQQNLSGTWKWMGGTTTYNPEYSSLGIFGAIACRVS